MNNSDKLQDIAIVINRPSFSLEVDTKYEFNQDDICREYYVGSNNTECVYDELPVTGGVTFTKIDSVRRIAFGVFEFTAYSSGCDKTVAVTDGRFGW